MADRKNLTISDIAQVLGVSKTTVSRAISGKGRISVDTRQKILSYIEEHNYHPNIIAKGLAKSKTYNIGLVVSGDYNIVELPFFQKCMLGICKVASSMDYDVLLTIVTDEDISQLKRVVINHKADGIILTRTHINDLHAKYLKKMGIPFVTIGSMEDDSVVQIDNDHKTACKDLTKKLFEQGSDKIAIIGGRQDYVVTKNRLEGFMSACRQMGKIPEKGNIYLGVENEESMLPIINKILDNETDCIVTMDDYLCGCVLKILHQKKVAIPDAIKVASFYNSTIWDNYISNVPSIIFDAEKLGEITCRILLKMIKGEEVSQRTLLGYSLTV